MSKTPDMHTKPPKPPSWALTLLEPPRTLAEKIKLQLSLPFLNSLPRGDGHPVMVIPGFAGDDRYNLPLIKFLRRQEFYAVGWNRGRNLGHGLLKPDILVERVNKLYNQTGKSVSLIGHSLGGVYAREIAKLWPHEVRQVISIGSPFGGGRATASRANILYKMLSPHKGVDDDNHWPEAPPVPTTAIYSRSDGIINWRIALQSHGHPKTENIEVYGCHNAMTVNAAVWYVINDRLTQAEENWQPFAREGLETCVYPRPKWKACNQY